MDVTGHREPDTCAGFPLPRCGGTYVLVMQAPEVVSVVAGRLGECTLEAGWYMYVGSAFGPGGLAARCARHQRTGKPMRWHLDYLRPQVALHEIWYRPGPQHLEHPWARVLESWPGTRIAWPRFGASDCRCATHLWYRPRRPQAVAFRRAAADDRIENLTLRDEDQ